MMSRFDDTPTLLIECHTGHQINLPAADMTACSWKRLLGLREVAGLLLVAACGRVLSDELAVRSRLLEPSHGPA